MKKILIVLFFVFLSISATSCDFKYPKSEFENLEQEIVDLEDRNMALRAQIRELNQQIETQKLDQESTTVMAEEDDPFDAQVLTDLLTRTDLIPISDDGQKMEFVPELCKVLGERYAYAYAQAERASADMIFAYDRKSDGTFSWTLELCNRGAGWLPMNTEQAAIQGLDALEPKETESTGESTSSAASSSNAAASGAASSGEEAPDPAQSGPAASEGSNAASSSGDLDGVLWTGTGKAPPPTELEQETFKNIADRVS